MGAAFALTRFSLVRLSIRSPGSRQKSLLRKSRVGGGVQNSILRLGTLVVGAESLRESSNHPIISPTGAMPQRGTSRPYCRNFPRSYRVTSTWGPPLGTPKSHSRPPPHPTHSKGGKDPHPQDFSLTKKMARFTKGQFRPY